MSRHEGPHAHLYRLHIPLTTMSKRPVTVPLPSTEYKLTFGDGSVSVLSVHPDESLRSALDKTLRAASGEPGTSAADVQSVELIGTLSFDETS